VTKNDTYHEGELAVQERLGVRERAEKMERVVHETIPDSARAFLMSQTLAVVCIVSDGRPRIVPIAGPPGFVHAESEVAIRFHDAFRGLPLELENGAAAGSIVIDLETRRRMRANGSAWRDGNDLVLKVDEVYANCPRFITPRRWSESEPSEASTASSIRLTDDAIALIRSADTFFIGTFHASRGADASHRGGEPGFVRVIDDKTLSWPDYDGNAMLNTLGNLSVEPRAALAFIDFITGSVLQLEGSCRLDVDAGGTRSMFFAIDEVSRTPGALAGRWSILIDSQPRDGDN